MGGVRVPKTPQLLSARCQLNSGPWVSAELLAGRAVSWSLAALPTDPRAHLRSLGEGGSS